MVVDGRCLNGFQIGFLLSRELEVLLDDLLEEATHVVCNRTHRDPSGTLRGVLLGSWEIGINSNRVNIFKSLLNFLGCQCDGMLSTAQILFEGFRRVKFKALIPHQLPRLTKRLFASSELEVVDVDAQDHVQLRMEVQAFPTTNTLKTKVQKSIGIVLFPIEPRHRMAVQTFK